MLLRLRVLPLLGAVPAPLRLVLHWHEKILLRLPVAGDELELVPLIVLDPYPHISAKSGCKV